MFDLIVSVLESVKMFNFWRRKPRGGKMNDFPHGYLTGKG